MEVKTPKGKLMSWKWFCDGCKRELDLRKYAVVQLRDSDNRTKIAEEFEICPDCVKLVREFFKTGLGLVTTLDKITDGRKKTKSPEQPSTGKSTN
jgi:hypothetical protein